MTRGGLLLAEVEVEEEKRGNLARPLERREGGLCRQGLSEGWFFFVEGGLLYTEKEKSEERMEREGGGGGGP